MTFLEYYITHNQSQVHWFWLIVQVVQVFLNVNT